MRDRRVYPACKPHAPTPRRSGRRHMTFSLCVKVQRGRRGQGARNYSTHASPGLWIRNVRSTVPPVPTWRGWRPPSRYARGSAASFLIDPISLCSPIASPSRRVCAYCAPLLVSLVASMSSSIVDRWRYTVRARVALALVWALDAVVPCGCRLTCLQQFRNGTGERATTVRATTHTTPPHCYPPHLRVHRACVTRVNAQRAGAASSSRACYRMRV